MECERVYVVRGESPRGPVSPGAGLLGMTTGGTGWRAASSAVGSAGADPTASESLFHTARSHRLSP